MVNPVPTGRSARGAGNVGTAKGVRAFTRPTSPQSPPLTGDEASMRVSEFPPQEPEHLAH